MASKKKKKRIPDESCLTTPSQERLPAVNTTPAIVEMLRDAIEHAVSVERNRMRRDFLTLTIVAFLLFIILMGTFAYFSLNLINELNAEREFAQKLITEKLEASTIPLTPPTPPTQLETEISQPPLTVVATEATSVGKTAGEHAVTMVEEPPSIAQTLPEPEPIPSTTTPQTKPVVTSANTQKKLSIAGLEAEHKEIEQLINAESSASLDLVTSLLEDRENELTKLREQLLKSASEITTEPLPDEPWELDDDTKESADDLISVDAKGVKLKIMPLTP
ncbi:MAG: hypothetical protein GX811_10930 [Lentisphaerae bacterium]|nr:hypothetical protein [Lentisphaerota bacterium]